MSGAAPPSHYEEAVARAVERIAAGDLDKVVLAREVRVHAPRDHDPAPVFDALRAAFPACYCWCVGTPELTFLGASPELLVRRDGARARPWPSPARPAGARTRPWTTTWASSSCEARRTGASRPSSSGASSVRSAP